MSFLADGAGSASHAGNVPFLNEIKARGSGLVVDLLQIKHQKWRQRLLQPPSPHTKPPLPPFFIFLLTNWREDDSDLAEGSAGFTVESSPVSCRASLFGFYVVFCVHVGQRVTSGQSRRACGRSRRCWIFIFIFYLSNTRRTKTSTEALGCCRCSLHCSKKTPFLFHSVCIKLLMFLSSVISVHQDVFSPDLAEFKRFADYLVPIIPVPAVICATLQHVSRKYHYFLIQPNNSKQKKQQQKQFWLRRNNVTHWDTLCYQTLALANI